MCLCVKYPLCISTLVQRFKSILHLKIHPSVSGFLKTKSLCDNVGGWVCHNPVMHLGAQTAKNLLIFKQAGEFLYLNGKQAASLALEDATQVG